MARTFTDSDGVVWTWYSILDDRGEAVVWDNRTASAVARYATRGEAEAAVAMAYAGRAPASWK